MSDKKDNLLDYMPRPNRLFEWRVGDNGHVLIKVEHKGFYAKIAQKIFKRPRFSDIELDDFGSFVWQRLDGKTTVYQIGQMVKNEFGEKAEPLYDRLGQYIKILHENKFIVYENKLK
ncbi:MAG: PqqD family protein [Candidatus Weimeria sp.]